MTDTSFESLKSILLVYRTYKTYVLVEIMLRPLERAPIWPKMGEMRVFGHQMDFRSKSQKYPQNHKILSRRKTISKLKKTSLALLWKALRPYFWFMERRRLMC